MTPAAGVPRDVCCGAAEPNTGVGSTPIGSGARFAGIWLGTATSQSLRCRTKPDRHCLGIYW